MLERSGVWFPGATPEALRSRGLTALARQALSPALQAPCAPIGSLAPLPLPGLAHAVPLAWHALLQNSPFHPADLGLRLSLH